MDLAQSDYLKAPSPRMLAGFGSSMAMSSNGKVLAIGAPGDSTQAGGTSGIASGSVYVFVASGDTWVFDHTLHADELDAGERFGASVAVSKIGDTIAVGVPEHLEASGAVYVYQGSTPPTVVLPSNPHSSDRFGTSVALDDNGTRLIVGAPTEITRGSGVDPATNTLGPDSGAVYMFEGATLSTQLHFFKSFDELAGIQFGTSVALSGDGQTFAVGAIGENSTEIGVNGSQRTSMGATASGAVFMFLLVNSAWTMDTYFKATNTHALASFGTSVALSTTGTTLAVGSSGESGAALGVGGDQQALSQPNAGAAYVYAKGAVWMGGTYIKATNTGMGDHFGASLSLSPDGDALIVGAPDEQSTSTMIDGTQSDDGGTSVGAAYTYRHDDHGDWSVDHYLKASNAEARDAFGASVAAGPGSLFVVGASGEASANAGLPADNSTMTAGAAYGFR